MWIDERLRPTAPWRPISEWMPERLGYIVAFRLAGRAVGCGRPSAGMRVVVKSVTGRPPCGGLSRCGVWWGWCFVAAGAVGRDVTLFA